MDVYTVEDVMRILCCKKSYAYKKNKRSKGYAQKPRLYFTTCRESP